MQLEYLDRGLKEPLPLLKTHKGAIAWRGVAPLLFIPVLDKIAHTFLGIFHSTVLPQLDLPRLKGFDKALSMHTLI
jgi:hypothetical protein